MGKKKTVNATVKQVVSIKAKRALASAFDIGLNASTSYEALVSTLAATFVPVRNAKGESQGVRPEERKALTEIGLAYKYGYMVGYFRSNVPGWSKRKGNLGPAELAEEMATIYAKPYPESSKPGRRTAVENRACRAADASLSAAVRRCELANPAKRKPRPSSGKATDNTPRELVAATPKFENREAANDHFATAFASLLATVNLNMQVARKRIISNEVSTIVQDAYQAMVKAGLIKPSK